MITITKPISMFWPRRPYFLAADLLQPQNESAHFQHASSETWMEMSWFKGKMQQPAYRTT